VVVGEAVETPRQEIRRPSYTKTESSERLRAHALSGVARPREGSVGPSFIMPLPSVVRAGWSE
jgi:hypothetical protein